MLADRKLLIALIVLAVTQLIGWGTLSLPAVLGRQMAADLDMDLTAVFGSTSVLYLAMGLCSPLLAQPFVRYGARRVMMAGTVIAAPGFVLLSVAQGPVSYYAAWLLLGLAGSATLSTAAYIVLNEIAGQNARGAIGALMLVTGLSSSIFWPTTVYLAGMLGWRSTCLVYAALLLLVSLPLYAFALPPRRKEYAMGAAGGSAAAPTAAPARSTFYLLVAAIGLNAFVAFGLSAVLIELLKAEGLTASEAISFGAMLGVIQVSARAVDFLGGGRWDGITTALVAGLALPVAMLLLMVSGGSYVAAATFILLYGLGSGALAVARATMPLVFYDKAEFAKASARIALPLNLLSAMSAPILVALLTRYGSNALLALVLACSCAALGMLLLLRRRRPGSAAVAAT
ncbi:putative Major Facilitator Superfamily (MFS) transporter [Bradyrhizobium sp. STM 3843]|uniref:MFS transporter n=1 Tax=Bradyrhizobium sp. STM 3843 TaxID=551947 RepID=UPI000240375C|nr:MFS transporter [Bradyrhizobium sp. STM 3843]CCE11447.1 putative Major Facilitator Superfamily (MFS) transporter [Bradyrhizobium sp. STM 3843]